MHTTQFTEDFKAIALGVILIPISHRDTPFGITYRSRGHFGIKHGGIGHIFESRTTSSQPIPTTNRNGTHVENMMGGNP